MGIAKKKEPEHSNNIAKKKEPEPSNNIAMKAEAVATNNINKIAKEEMFELVNKISCFVKREVSKPINNTTDLNNIVQEILTDLLKKEEPEPSNNIAKAKEPEPSNNIAMKKEPEPSNNIAEKKEPEPSNNFVKTEEIEPTDITKIEEPELSNNIDKEKEPESSNNIIMKEESEPTNSIAKKEEPEPANTTLMQPGRRTYTMSGLMRVKLAVPVARALNLPTRFVIKSSDSLTRLINRQVNAGLVGLQPEQAGRRAQQLMSIILNKKGMRCEKIAFVREGLMAQPNRSS